MEWLRVGEKYESSDGWRNEGRKERWIEGWKDETFIKRRSSGEIKPVKP